MALKKFSRPWGATIHIITRSSGPSLMISCLTSMAQKPRGAGPGRVRLPVHHAPALAAEADLQLHLVAVRVLAHAAAGGDRLIAHGQARVGRRVGVGRGGGGAGGGHGPPG